MSIAEKLQTIAENEQKVYNSGLEQGYTQGYEKGSMPIYYLNNLSGTWRQAVFPENTELTIKMNLGSNACENTFFQTTNLKSVKLTNDNTDMVIIANNMFRQCEQLEVIDITEFNRKFSSINWFILGCKKLKTILGALDLSNCTSFTLPFHIDNGALADIEIVPYSIKATIPFNYCPNLTDKSIQSIIDGLADLTGQTTQTVTFHSTVGNKLTDTQKATITAKNWTLAY